MVKPAHIPKELWDKSDNQKPLVAKNTFAFGSSRDKYKPEYCDLAFKILCSAGKTNTHVANALNCTILTIYNWRKKYPAFDEAIKLGKARGEVLWREKIFDFAFKPSGLVNNGLIKLLSANVYGIKDEPEINLVINNNSVDPETLLKERGIPLPNIPINDIEE